MSGLNPDVTDRLTALFSLYEALKADVDFCWIKVREEPSEIHRRNAVRATLAFMEGVTFALKQLVLAWLSDSLGTLPWRSLTREELGRLALLREESYDLDDKGKVAIRSARLNLSRNLRFAFDAFFEVINKTRSPIDASTPEWNQFRDAIRIRDRLTHPKLHADITVSPEEVLLVNRVYNWFHALFSHAFGRTGTRPSAGE
jgi:hypothetical protein